MDGIERLKEDAQQMPTKKQYPNKESRMFKKKNLYTIRYYLDKYISPPYSSVTSTPPLFLRTRMLLLSLLRRLLLQIAHVLRVVVDLLLVGRDVRLGRRRQLLVPLALALLLLLELLLFDALELFGAAVGVFLQAELLGLREWADGGGAGGCWEGEGARLAGDAGGEEHGVWFWGWL
jgi:hypothetical protein